MEKALEYARRRRDNAYVLYSINADHSRNDYTLADEQYYMGKWHEAMDHYWYLEKLTQNVG
jgi:hypothetical protein